MCALEIFKFEVLDLRRSMLKRALSLWYRRSIPGLSSGISKHCRQVDGEEARSKYTSLFQAPYDEEGGPKEQFDVRNDLSFRRIVLERQLWTSWGTHSWIFAALCTFLRSVSRRNYIDDSSVGYETTFVIGLLKVRSLLCDLMGRVTLQDNARLSLCIHWPRLGHSILTCRISIS